MIPECLCVIALLSPPVVQAQHTDPLEGALRYPARVSAYVDEQEALARERAAEVAARSSVREPVQTLDVGLDWAALRKCESGGDYAIDTGNGYYGAYQFSWSTWAAQGGSGNPALASPAEQDMRAQRLYDAAGSSPWPVCGALL